MKGFKLKDILISILIVSVTLLYFSDRYFIPNGLETVNIFGLKISSHGLFDISKLIYFSKMKLLILFYAILWYISCKHWWRQTILIIIIIELFKLATIFNYNNTRMDEIEYLVSLPVTVPLIVLLVFLSIKINNFRISNEVRNSLDLEIDNTFFNLNQDKFEEFDEMKKKMMNIKRTKYKNKESYINELISIRDEFYKL